MLMRSRHEASPHSQTRSRGCDVSAKPSARPSIRSFTSRNTASFRPIRSSRLAIGRSLEGLFYDDVFTPARDNLTDRLFSLLMSHRGHEMLRILAYGGVLLPRQMEDLDALLDGTLAQERNAFHLDAELVRPVADTVVGFAERRVVRLDSLRDCVRHWRTFARIPRR